jgi:anti-anti-sigma regulatory factor
MSDASLELPAILDTGNFESVRESLLAAPQSETVRLNSANVERVTTPGAQLLASFLNNNKKAALISPSPALRAAWSDLGLSALFPFKE